MKHLLIAVFLLILAPVSGLTQGKTSPAGRIEYSADRMQPLGFTVLRATDTATGKTYELIGSSKEMCLEVIDQRDFDGNGFVDALVEYILGCGGNCCGDSFFFVSNLGGRFELSDEFGYSWSDPVIEKWKGRWSVLVVSASEGVDNRELLETTQRLILEAGKAVQVEEWKRKEMESVTEIYLKNRAINALSFDVLFVTDKDSALL